MIIKIELDTYDSGDLLALKSLVEILAEDVVKERPWSDDDDRASGPVKKFDQSKVTIWSTEENGELAKQNINLDDNVEDVALNTIVPKKEKTDDEVVECDNSLKLEQKVVLGTFEEEAQKLGEGAMKALDKGIKAVVDANIIEDTLKQLDPPPEDQKVNNAVTLRKLMIAVVKAHGAKGARAASQIVKEIAGVQDVAKIPADKIEAVKEGLTRAVASDVLENASSSQPASDVAFNTIVPKKEKPTSNADDVDF